MKKSTNKKNKKDKKDKKDKKKNKAKKSRAPSCEGSADARSTWSQTKREMSASTRRQASQAQLGGRDYLFPPPEANGGGQVSRSPVRGGGMGGSSPNRGARSYGRLSERGVRSLSASRPDMQTDALNRVRMLEDTRGRVHELVPRRVHQTQGGDARSVGSARSARSARTPSVASSAGKSSGRSSKGSARSVSSARTPSVAGSAGKSPRGSESWGDLISQKRETAGSTGGSYRGFASSSSGRSERSQQPPKQTKASAKAAPPDDSSGSSSSSSSSSSTTSPGSEISPGMQRDWSAFSG